MNIINKQKKIITKYDAKNRESLNTLLKELNKLPNINAKSPETAEILQLIWISLNAKGYTKDINTFKTQCKNMFGVLNEPTYNNITDQQINDFYEAKQKKINSLKKNMTDDKNNPVEKA